MTRGFPGLYSANEKQTWTIHTEIQSYIEVKFETFDVYEHPLESCTKDFVEVFDFDLPGNEQLIGR